MGLVILRNYDKMGITKGVQLYNFVSDNAGKEGASVAGYRLING